MKFVPLFVFLFALPLTLSCTSAVGSGGDGGSDGAADPGSLTLAITAPDAVTPDRQFVVTVTVTDEDGATVENAAVTVEATLEAGDVVTGKLSAQGAGAYSIDDLVLPDAGDWALSFSASTDDAEGTETATLPSSCQFDGTVGAMCCTSSDCMVDHFCVIGACAAKRLVGGDACESPADCASDLCENGICKELLAPLLGQGDGTPASATLTVIETKLLTHPTDLAFDPADTSKLWVVSPGADRVTLILNPGTPQQKTTGWVDWQKHFLEEVLSIAFGDGDTFATCGDSRNEYDGLAPPNDFMGPALWPSPVSDWEIFGPDASAVHLDMLHNSPNCVGVAADTANAFWVFNGRSGVLDWYDFKVPHPHGTEDHSDGTKRRYLNVALKRVPGVTANMLVHPDSGWLYIADTGNSRILRVDTSAASQTGQFATYPNEQPMQLMSGEITEEFVPASAELVYEPSGMALHDGFLYVSDHASGFLIGLDETGARVNFFDTGLGAGGVGGITVGPDNLLYLVDVKGSRVLRLDP